MNQHPVPQHISSYEFKLVGDMTLKQFFQLAGGVVVSLLIYASPLPSYVKWPGVVVFAAIGAALAFLPFEDRPLSTWFFAFIKAIYSPTIYTYVANSQEDVFAKGITQNTTQDVLTPVGQTKTEEYLSSVPSAGFVDSFEKAEKNFFNKLGHMFQNTPPASLTATQTLNTQPAILTNTQVQPTQPAPQISREMPMQIPAQPVIKVENHTVSSPVPQVQNSGSQAPVQSVFGPGGGTQVPTSQASFNTDATPPSPPEIPNTIVGQVLTAEGKIVEGAILEIRDTNKKPVRAVRTNRVGHFITATPLSDGDYEIETEKPGFTFETVHFKAEGGLIPPIQIKAK